MIGMKVPTDIGYLHHEPLVELIRAKAATLSGTVKTRIEAARTFIASNYQSASWDTSKTVWYDGLTTTQRNQVIAAWRSLFTPYPNLLPRFEALLKAFQSGGPLWPGTPRISSILSWPDGASVTVDAASLPVLPDRSRYTLARWIEAQADAQRPGPHYVFVASKVPIVGFELTSPDNWMGAWNGY